MVRSFKDLKKSRKTRFNRVPQAASVIAEVVSTDPDNDRITVRLSSVAAAALKLDDQGKALALSIKQAASDRQPNMNDLLGKKGGNARNDMKVEPGSFLRLDNVSVDGETLQTSWANLAAGPRALANDDIQPKLASGMIRTSYRNTKSQDGEDVRRWATEIMFPDQAVKVDNVANLSAAAERILTEYNLDGMARAQALVRITDGETGDPFHLIIQQRWNKQAEAMETPDAAVARLMEDQTLKLAELDMSGVSVEVVPMTRLLPGGETRKQLNCLMTKNLKLNTFRGAGKYDVTEIHQDQRLVRNAGGINSRKPASAESLQLAKNIAGERGRNTEFGDKPTQGQVSAWLDENTLKLGWARGDVLVRFNTDKETGETFAFAAACSTTTRTGIAQEAITTPHASNHGEWLKRELLESRNIRKDAHEDTVIIEGGPDAPGQEEVSHAQLDDAYGDEPLTAEELAPPFN